MAANFCSIRPRDVGDEGIDLGAPTRSDTYKLTRSENADVYLSPGWLLWVRAGTADGAADFERKALTGTRCTLASPVVYESITNASAISVSASGLVAYRAGRINRRQLTWFDRSGRARAPGAVDENRLSSPSLSPMVIGSRCIASSRATPTSGSWTTFERCALRLMQPLTVTRSGRPTARESCSTRIGRGRAACIRRAPLELAPRNCSWSRRRTSWPTTGPLMAGSCFIKALVRRMERDLWVLPLEGGRKPWVFLRSATAERFGQFSPDGHWVAFQSDESGHYEIYVRPFPGPGSRVLVSTAGGAQVRWRRRWTRAVLHRARRTSDGCANHVGG